MTLPRYVVTAIRVQSFATLSEAREYSLSHYPSVILERRRDDDGVSRLHEIGRHDFLYDFGRGEWRAMLRESPVPP